MSFSNCTSVNSVCAVGLRGLMALRQGFLALALAALSVGWAPFGLAQPADGDYFSVKHNSDYYAYRFHPSYSSPTQLLRTVEYNHQRLGMDRIRERRFQNAYYEFLFVLNVFPNHPEALIGMEEVCRNLKTATCSMDTFLDKAITVNPEASGTYVVEGIYFARKGKYRDAIESYKKAVALKPDSASAQYNLGLAYFEVKDYGLANDHAQKAYALGFPLPGLRERLRKVGAWKPIEQAAEPRTAQGAEQPAAAAAPPGDAPSPPSDEKKANN